MWIVLKVHIIFYLLNGPIQIAYGFDKNNPALLVVSLDAFRPEYFRRHVTPFMEQFRKNGGYAPYMQNVFPTKTFVNHFSIATGLYAESHGVLGNSLYDLEQGEMGYSYNLFHYNISSIPIWTWNELSGIGRRSGCMMWPGSNYKYLNRYCTFSRELDKSVSWEERVKTALSWFKHKYTPANLVMMYMEEPDEEGHAFGPEADVQTRMVRKLDMLINYLMNRIYLENLNDKLNVIFVSDHGMDTVVTSNFINITSFIEPNSAKMYGSSPVLQIIPSPGKEEEVMSRLTAAAEQNGNFNVYNKTNMPARWRVKNERRFGPIIAVAEPKYAFDDMHELAKWFKVHFRVPISPQTRYGVHGYDNAVEEMHAIFMGQGPSIRKGVVLPVFDTVDLYNLFCILLKIKTRRNDGVDRSDIWKMFLKPNFV